MVNISSSIGQTLRIRVMYYTSVIRIDDCSSEVKPPATDSRWCGSGSISGPQQLTINQDICPVISTAESAADLVGLMEVAPGVDEWRVVVRRSGPLLVVRDKARCTLKLPPEAFVPVKIATVEPL